MLRNVATVTDRGLNKSGSVVGLGRPSISRGRNFFDFRLPECPCSNSHSIAGKESPLPIQMHHFATNKHKAFTPRMEKIAKQFGLELNEAWNKKLMHHLGRHPNDYHEFVLFNMKKAAKEAKGDAKVFVELFEEYVKTPVINNPDLLNKSGW